MYNLHTHPHKDHLKAFALDYSRDNVGARTSEVDEHIKHCEQCASSVRKLKSLKTLLKNSILVDSKLIGDHHVDDQTIIEYVNHSKDEFESLRIQNHLAECGECMTAVLEYRAYLAEKNFSEERVNSTIIPIGVSNFLSTIRRRQIVAWPTVPLIAASIVLGMSIQVLLESKEEIAPPAIATSESLGIANKERKIVNTVISAELSNQAAANSIPRIDLSRDMYAELDIVLSNSSKKHIDVINTKTQKNQMQLSEKSIVAQVKSVETVGEPIKGQSNASSKDKKTVKSPAKIQAKNSVAKRGEVVKPKNIINQETTNPTPLVVAENKVDIVTITSSQEPSSTESQGEQAHNFLPIPDRDPNKIKDVPFDTWQNQDQTRFYSVDPMRNTLTIADQIESGINKKTIITVGRGASGVIGNHDDTKVFVTNKHEGTLSVIDTATHTLEKNIVLGSNPYCMTFSSDEKHLYVVNRYGDKVNVIDPVKLMLTSTSRISELDIEVRYNNCYYGCHQDKRRNMQRVAAKLHTGPDSEMYNADYLDKRGEDPHFIVDFLKIRELSKISNKKE